MFAADVAIVHEIPKKQQTAGELLRNSFLESPGMEMMLPMLANVHIMQQNKEATPEEIAALVKEKILEDSFIYKHTSSIESEFDQDELQLLVTYYTSDVMKRFQKKHMDQQQAIMFAMNEIYGEILAEYPTKIAIDDSILKITDDNFAQEIENSSLPVVLDCYATWCGPCKVMAPIFEELKKEYEGKVKFVKLDVDQSNELAKKLGVSAMPTFLFYKDGGIVAQQVGGMDKDSFKELLNSTFKTK